MFWLRFEKALFRNSWNKARILTSDDWPFSSLKKKKDRLGLVCYFFYGASSALLAGSSAAAYQHIASLDC